MSVYNMMNACNFSFPGHDASRSNLSRSCQRTVAVTDAANVSELLNSTVVEMLGQLQRAITDQKDLRRTGQTSNRSDLLPSGHNSPGPKTHNQCNAEWGDWRIKALAARIPSALLRVHLICTSPKV